MSKRFHACQGWHERLRDEHAVRAMVLKTVTIREAIFQVGRAGVREWSHRLELAAAFHLSRLAQAVR